MLLKSMILSTVITVVLASTSRVRNLNSVLKKSIHSISPLSWEIHSIQTPMTIKSKQLLDDSLQSIQKSLSEASKILTTIKKRNITIVISESNLSTAEENLAELEEILSRILVRSRELLSISPSVRISSLLAEVGIALYNLLEQIKFLDSITPIPVKIESEPLTIVEQGATAQMVLGQDVKKDEKVVESMVYFYD